MLSVDRHGVRRRAAVPEYARSRQLHRSMIELARISREFPVGGQIVHALDDVDLTIGAGEYVSIMGPSGSGKSTLLNMLGLLDRPTTGTYRLEGEDVSRLDDDALARARASGTSASCSSSFTWCRA